MKRSNELLEIVKFLSENEIIFTSVAGKDYFSVYLWERNTLDSKGTKSFLFPDDKECGSVNEVIEFAKSIKLCKQN